MIVADATQRAIELAETAAWLDALYSQCSADDGELVFIEPSKKAVHRCFKLGSRDALVAAARAVCGVPGLYLKINCMDADKMRQRAVRDRKGRYIVGDLSEVKTIVAFICDVDAGKDPRYPSREEALTALDRMPRLPTLIVNSGSGGFHAYWQLAKPYRIRDGKDRDAINQASARWQQRLRELLNGRLDYTANLDRVLRVVGGVRLDGARVTCHEYEPERLYKPGDLWIEKPKPKPVRGLRIFPSAVKYEDAIDFVTKTPRVAIDGQAGGRTCLHVAIRLLEDFKLGDDEALRVLATHYNPRCDPPWSERELIHKVREARKKVGA